MKHGRTNIYIYGQLFNQSKHLVLSINLLNINKNKGIRSIDEAAIKLEKYTKIRCKRAPQISPDVEFWGHSSNLQAWVDHN